MLNVLFKDSGISYVIKDNEVILKSTPVVVATPQQSNKIVVKGNIRDTLGESVIGATIMEKNNAQNGSISDINGDFLWRANLCATFLGNLVYPTPASKMLHFP